MHMLFTQFFVIYFIINFAWLSFGEFVLVAVSFYVFMFYFPSEMDAILNWLFTFLLKLIRVSGILAKENAAT